MNHARRLSLSLGLAIGVAGCTSPSGLAERTAAKGEHELALGVLDMELRRDATHWDDGLLGMFGGRAWNHVLAPWNWLVRWVRNPSEDHAAARDELIAEARQRAADAGRRGDLGAEWLSTTDVARDDADNPDHAPRLDEQRRRLIDALRRYATTRRLSDAADFDAALDGVEALAPVQATFPGYAALSKRVRDGSYAEHVAAGQAALKQKDPATARVEAGKARRARTGSELTALDEAIVRRERADELITRVAALEARGARDEVALTWLGAFQLVPDDAEVRGALETSVGDHARWIADHARHDLASASEATPLSDACLRVRETPALDADLATLITARETQRREARRRELVAPAESFVGQGHATEQAGRAWIGLLAARAATGLDPAHEPWIQAAQGRVVERSRVAVAVDSGQAYLWPSQLGPAGAEALRQAVSAWPGSLAAALPPGGQAAAATPTLRLSFVLEDHRSTDSGADRPSQVASRHQVGMKHNPAWDDANRAVAVASGVLQAAESARDLADKPNIGHAIAIGAAKGVLEAAQNRLAATPSQIPDIREYAYTRFDLARQVTLAGRLVLRGPAGEVRWEQPVAAERTARDVMITNASSTDVNGITNNGNDLPPAASIAGDAERDALDQIARGARLAFRGLDALLGERLAQAPESLRVEPAVDVLVGVRSLADIEGRSRLVGDAWSAVRRIDPALPARAAFPGLSILDPEDSWSLQLEQQANGLSVAGLGVALTGLDPSGLAAQLGLARGDVLLKVNSVPAVSPPRTLEQLAALRPGDALRLDWLRAGEPRTWAGALPHGALGVTCQIAPDGRPGALVATVNERLPAKALGIRPGDRIVSLGNGPVAGPDGLGFAISRLPAGSLIRIGIERDGRPLTLDCRLGSG